MNATGARYFQQTVRHNLDRLAAGIGTLGDLIAVNLGGIAAVLHQVNSDAPDDDAGNDPDDVKKERKKRNREKKREAARNGKNPNQKKGAEGRQKTGDRERKRGHPDGEEHSIKPKGGFRRN